MQQDKVIFKTQLYEKLMIKKSKIKNAYAKRYFMVSKQLSATLQ